MNNIEQLKLLLNCDNLSDYWYLSYGITRTKNNALTKILDRPHKDSIYNPNPESAETVLTLFLLGNIDKWNQIGIFNIPPRIKNEKSDWNKEFFSAIRKNKNVFKKIKNDILWKDLLNEKLKINNINYQESILLFEFRIVNSAFHSVDNKPFKELSFLDIKERKKWSQFDALLIIPSIKLFIFFEAKLKGYTDDFIKRQSAKPPQIIRNLESAYLLTNHEKSRYNDWDFIYVFISPKDIKDINKYYSMLDNAGAQYEDLLEEMQKSSCFEKYFLSFKKDISKHILKMNWNEVGNVLKKNNPKFFIDYFNNLKGEVVIGEEQIEIIRKRLEIAGIKL